MSTIALIDISAIFWANYHARGDQGANDARNAVVGQCHSIAEDYDHTAVCLDVGPYKRCEVYKGYKETRGAHDALAVEQFRRTIEDLENSGDFPTFGVKGHEADDVIGTLCARLCEGSGHHITIVSPDKDLLQCLREGQVERLNTRVHPPEVMGEAGVRDHLGFGPKLIPQWLALMGDSSDNIPGVDRCGKKTAAKWIVEFSGVNSLIGAAISNDVRLTELQRKNITAAANRAECPLSMAVELATVKTNLPLDVDAIFAERVPKPKPDQEDDMPPSHDDAPLPEPSAPEAEPTQPSEREPDPEPSQPEKPAQAEQKPKQTKALVKVDSADPWALEPPDMTSAVWLSRKINNSRLFSKKFKNQDEALVAMLAGRRLGLGAVESLMAIHVIEGTPGYSAHLLVARAKEHPDCEYFAMKESTADSCTYVTKRKGTPVEESMTYTVDQAESAGLTRPSRNGKPSNWVRIPAEMCRKQAAVELVRAVYPDAFHGAPVYTPEEITDGRVIDAEWEEVE
jgi:5'-3' exonuclease